MQESKRNAQLFTSKRINDIAEGDFNFILEMAAFHEKKLPHIFSVLDVFELCFLELSKSYRAEYYFKSIVAKKILFGIHSLNTATVIPEFRVGKNKADCVVLNGKSVCYEIKSRYDNLSRLPEQLNSYQKIFDQVVVVTSDEHLEKVLCNVPCDVGVIELTKRNTLRVVKSANDNKEPVDVSVLMRSLRLKEYKEMVRLVTGKTPLQNNTEIFEVCERELSQVSSQVLREIFCKVLKETRKIDKEYVTNLPESLLMAGIGYNMKLSSKKSLIKNLKINLSKDLLCTIQSSEVNSLS
ncbi:MAG: sce7726 family protein [Halomonas sp.]|nr:sce7726 family protein [Halomonas sp.]MBP5979771.1 sce7726 family protein [Halomonas sp.]